jgi:hypothetical protein
LKRRAQRSRGGYHYQVGNVPARQPADEPGHIQNTVFVQVPAAQHQRKLFFSPRAETYFAAVTFHRARLYAVDIAECNRSLNAKIPADTF